MGPASYKWSYNPGYPVIRPFIGVITPFITSRGPPCRYLRVLIEFFGFSMFQVFVGTPPDPVTVTTKTIPFLVGNPNLNLHLSLLLGGGYSCCFFVRIQQGVSSLLALFLTQPQKKHRDDGSNPAITTWDV